MFTKFKVQSDNNDGYFSLEVYRPYEALYQFDKYVTCLLQVKTGSQHASFGL